MEGSSGLFTDLRVDESVRIGDVIVTLLDKTGKKARLSVKAPKEVPITIERKKEVAN